MKEQVSFRSAWTNLLDDSHTSSSMAELMESTGPVMMVASIIEELHRHGFSILGRCEDPLVVGLFRPRLRIPQRGAAYDIPDECLYIELHLDSIQMIWVKLHPEQEKEAFQVLKDLRKSGGLYDPAYLCPGCSFDMRTVAFHSCSTLDPLYEAHPDWTMQEVAALARTQAAELLKGQQRNQAIFTE